MAAQRIGHHREVALAPGADEHRRGTSDAVRRQPGQGRVELDPARERRLERGRELVGAEGARVGHDHSPAPRVRFGEQVVRERRDVAAAQRQHEVARDGA